MKNIKTSRLVPFGIAYVTENKEIDSDIIKAVPIEVITNVSGDIASYNEEFKNDLESNTFESNSNASVEAGAIVEATWIGMSNRDTAPNLYVNEPVRLYKMLNTENYFWEELYRTDSELRRLETVRYIYSNNPEQDLSEYDLDKSYWIEWSTIDKKIHLHTSDNDGELAAYDITIDTAEGTVSLKDSNSNSLVLNSPKRLLTADLLKTVLNSPDIILNGDTVITKTLKVESTSKLEGSVQVDAGLNVDGSILGGSVRSKTNSHLR